jgi:CubicO group peptidase (beta-lactamase class C family)
MKSLFLYIFFISTNLFSQSLYFPPISGDDWEILSLHSQGWDSTKIDNLYGFLQDNNTKAFLVLKNGKIIIEKYFDTFTKDSLWYWASAGKTITSLLVGLAQQEGFLSIDDSTSKFLGNGWTSAPPEKEKLITIKDQLSMTSGLNDLVFNSDCTSPDCLQYLAEAGTRWAYHNAPYTLLDSVIQNSTGLTLNQYFNSRVRTKIGMNGFFIKSGFNNVMFSTPRSMARFGLLILNGGKWENNVLLTDNVYFNQMINSSQTINKSYGYLWWLNGKESYMLPQSQLIFPGELVPNAPSDMFSGMGKNGQFLNIVPSEKLIVIRMGDSPDNSFVPNLLNNDLWIYLNDVINPLSVVEANDFPPHEYSLEQNYPNPFNPSTKIKFSIPLNTEQQGLVHIRIYDVLGNEIAVLLNEYMVAGNYEIIFDAVSKNISSGIYFYKLEIGNFISVKKMIYLK